MFVTADHEKEKPGSFSTIHSSLQATNNIPYFNLGSVTLPKIFENLHSRVERFRGVFKKFLKCNRQELLKVVPHHNEETPKFFWKSINIFRWRK